MKGEKNKTPERVSFTLTGMFERMERAKKHPGEFDFVSIRDLYIRDGIKKAPSKRAKIQELEDLKEWYLKFLEGIKINLEKEQERGKKLSHVETIVKLSIKDYILKNNQMTNLQAMYLIEYLNSEVLLCKKALKGEIDSDIKEGDQKEALDYIKLIENALKLILQDFNLKLSYVNKYFLKNNNEHGSRIPRKR